MAGYDTHLNHPGSRLAVTAVVYDCVEAMFGVTVHDFAVVGRLPDTFCLALAREPPINPGPAVIGSGTVIGCHATIYAGARIGKDCLIGDYAVVREGAVIGDRCVIGMHSIVSYDAVLGNECRVQSHSHITDGLIAGDGCFFGVGVATFSDRRIDLDNYAFHGSQGPKFGKGVMVGSGAVIMAGIVIGNKAVIGAGALVIKSVPDGAKVLGDPAQVFKAAMVGVPTQSSAYVKHGTGKWGTAP